MTVIGILTGHPAAIWAVLACSLKLKESKAKGGGLVVEGVSGNAAKSGIKPGDTIIYASSWFGDELWPTDKLSFTISAIQRAPSLVAFVYVSATLCLQLRFMKQARCDQPGWFVVCVDPIGSCLGRGLTSNHELHHVAAVEHLPNTLNLTSSACSVTLTPCHSFRSRVRTRRSM
jgi:hypothetical protein